MSKGRESRRGGRAWAGEVLLGEKGVGREQEGVEGASSPLSANQGAPNPLPPGPGAESFPHLPCRPARAQRLPLPAPPPGDWLCSPDRWWGAQLVRYQPSPGASPSHSAAASLRLGPQRVIKHRPGPGPASFPSLLWPGWQVGTGDKDWGLRQFWGRQLNAPCPLSGQEHGGGEKVSASPARQGPRDGVPTILVLPVGRGLRRSLERPRQPAGDSASPPDPSSPLPTLSARAGQQLPQPLLVKPRKCEGLEGKQRDGISVFRPWQASEGSDWNPPGTTGGRGGRECSFMQGGSDPRQPKAGWLVS